MSALLPEPTLHWSGEGPPLVLLHALGVDRTAWDHVVASTPGYEVLTYDLPGHGATPPPAERYTIEDVAEQLADVLRGAGRGPAHVVGASLGGLVALVLAAEHPELVDHLVLVDSVAVYPPPVQEQWRQRRALVREQGLEPLLRATLDLWFTADAVAADTPAVQQVRRLFLAGDPEGYARTCEALEVVDLTGLVSSVVAPTLVVCGEDDAPAFTAAAPRLADEVADGRLVWLAPARHAGVLEQPEQFVRALTAFLPAGG